MARKTHLIVTVEDRIVHGRTESVKIAACGETTERWTGDHYAPAGTPLESINCPKCSAAYAKTLLAAHPRGVGLRTEPFPKTDGGRQPYRSAYRLFKDAKHIGYIVYDGGWRGGSWKVCNLSVRNDDISIEMGPELGRRTPKKPTERNPLDFYESTPVLSSKEAAMVFAMELIGEDRLPDADAMIQRRKDHRAWEARYAAERAAEDAEQARLTAETIEGLREMIVLSEQGLLLLTNFQKTALENALLLGFKVSSQAPTDD